VVGRVGGWEGGREGGRVQVGVGRYRRRRRACGGREKGKTGTSLLPLRAPFPPSLPPSLPHYLARGHLETDA
jgi:hypothetical protein